MRNVKTLKINFAALFILLLTIIMASGRVYANMSNSNSIVTNLQSNSLNYRNYADNFFAQEKFIAAQVLYELESILQPGDSTIEARLQYCYSINERLEEEKSPFELCNQIVEEANVLFDLGLFEIALELFEFASIYNEAGKAYLEGIERCEQAIFNAMQNER